MPYAIVSKRGNYLSRCVDAEKAWFDYSMSIEYAYLYASRRDAQKVLNKFPDKQLRIKEVNNYD